MKKSRKVIVKKVAKAEVPNKNARRIAALMSLQAHEGWAIILEVLDQNKAFLERMILEGKDVETGELLTADQTANARDKRSMLIELIETPQRYIDQLNMGSHEHVNLDPYFSSFEDIM